METLFLADFEEFNTEELVAHVISSYETDETSVECFEFLIAYESVGSWGCDSASFFLLRHKDSGQLYEVHGSHCSCYGFEGQWQPDETSLEYLTSDKFYFCCGGYDDERDMHHQLVKEYVAAL